jgi:DNA-binding response OmpR family regulator
MTMTPTTRPLSVLVVDDAPDCTDTLAVLLRLHGHDARTANGWEQALAMLGDWRPDAAILNVKSHDLAGIELACRLRAGAEPPPLLLALTGPADAARESAVGFDHHFPKPVDPGALLAVLSVHSGPRRQPD